jgi:rubrerythrin
VSDKYADQRPFRERHCYRVDLMPKKRYTRAAARAQAERRPGYHAYRCPDCGHWHVGTARQQQQP